jgi:hypothetical protein
MRPLECFHASMIAYRLLVWALAPAMLLLAGCSDETIFESNFDNTAVNEPPAASQAVGTAAIAGPTGSVLIVAAPDGLNGKWLRLQRPNADTGFPAFQGILSQVGGQGRYTFSTIMFMPTGADATTISFEQLLTPPQMFLHLDFMPENNVRIDDNEATRFGTFPRDQPFIVQVTLDTTATPSAHVVLSGAGASGITDYTIQPSLQQYARQFGAIRFWIGFPHLGEFYATTVVVTRRKT